MKIVTFVKTRDDDDVDREINQFKKSMKQNHQDFMVDRM